MEWWRCGRPVTSNSYTSTLAVMLVSELWTYRTIKGQSRQLYDSSFEANIERKPNQHTQYSFSKWGQQNNCSILKHLVQTLNNMRYTSIIL